MQVSLHEADLNFHENLHLASYYKFEKFLKHTGSPQKSEPLSVVIIKVN